ncbi:MAG: hypothetical protein K2P59_07595, partial [Acetatifactor sp.]|nr:hypothetical protein [Acetatifactor sp.]
MKKTKRVKLKKAVAVGLSLLMLAGVLSGCGDGRSVTTDGAQSADSQIADDRTERDREGSGGPESGQSTGGQAEISIT